jgi:hypothetical protein
MRFGRASLVLLLLSCGSVAQPQPDSGGPPADAGIPDVSPPVCPDLDGDGHAQIACGGDDCDDHNPLVHPGLAELCDDIDNNCNRIVDEAPAGQECMPGQICSSGRCGCPASGGSGACTGVISDGGSFLDGGAQSGGDMQSAGDATCTMATGQYGPFPMCQAPSDGAGCDVVCQSGCSCNQVCRIEHGSAVCGNGGPVFLQQYDSCDPDHDQCRPGNICLQEASDHPACGSHCYRHCRDNYDCPTGSKCSIELQFGGDAGAGDARVCSPPQDGCNPFGQARCNRADRPYPTFGCYLLSSSFPDVAVCDCAGTVKIGDPCSYEHECEPGAECVSAGTRICRHVCKVGATGPPATGGCPVGMTCTPFPKGSTFGYCHG